MQPAEIKDFSAFGCFSDCLLQCSMRYLKWHIDFLIVKNLMCMKDISCASNL